MPRARVLVTFALGATLALAACGGGDDDDEDEHRHREQEGERAAAGRLFAVERRRSGHRA
jgi:hypothetical protein